MEDARILRGVIRSLIVASGFLAISASAYKESYCNGSGCQVYGPDINGIGGGWGGGRLIAT